MSALGKITRESTELRKRLAVADIGLCRTVKVGRFVTAKNLLVVEKVSFSYCKKMPLHN